MTRIGLLTGSFFPRIGGGESHALALSRALRQQGHEVFVLTRRHEKSCSDRDEVEGVPVRRVGPAGFPRWGKYLMLASAYRILVRLSNEYDVIYVCGLRVLGWAGVAAARRTGNRCFLRAEAQGEWSGAFIWDRPGGASRPLLKKLFQPLIRWRNRYLKHADGFVSIAPTITDEFMAAGVDKQQIHFIPNGIDPEIFHPMDPEERPALRHRLGLPGKRIAIYCGKLNRGKGLDMLLRAWNHLIRSGAGDLHLVLAGAGGGQYLSCEQALRDYVAAQGLGHAVTFTGYVTQVADYLQAADCFVLPSDSEAFPMSLLEAQACGLPCIGTDTGGIPEIIRNEETGLVIPVKDETALGKALHRLLSDPVLAARYGRQARTECLSRYSITRIAEQHAALFAR